MGIADAVRAFHLAYLSKPGHNRPLYRAIRRQKPAKILTLGIGDGRRARQMTELALRYRQDVEMVGVDLFEARPATDPGLSLKSAHQTLGATGARVRLLPGDPYLALARSANDLGKIDLMFVPEDTDPEALARAWFYVPRMLHNGTRIYQEVGSEEKIHVRAVTHTEIEALAAQSRPSRAA